MNDQRHSSAEINDTFDKAIINTNDLVNCVDQHLKEHIKRLSEERDTLLRTGVYSNSDAIIVELDKRIRDCLKEAKQSVQN